MLNWTACCSAIPVRQSKAIITAPVYKHLPSKVRNLRLHGQNLIKEAAAVPSKRLKPRLHRLSTSESVVVILQDKDYTAAAQLAFELKQPGRLLAVVTKACEGGPSKAHHILTKLVAELSEEELKLCLEYMRDWNTNSRHCSMAQAMLQAVLVQHPPQVSLLPQYSHQHCVL